MFYLAVFAVLMFIAAIVELVIVFKLRKKVDRQSDEIDKLVFTRNISSNALVYQRSDIVTLNAKVAIPMYLLNRNSDMVTSMLIHKALDSISEEFIRNPRLYKLTQNEERMYAEDTMLYKFEVSIVTHE